jgi:anti-anti-sigma factor
VATANAPRPGDWGSADEAQGVRGLVVSGLSCIVRSAKPAQIDVRGELDMATAPALADLLQMCGREFDGNIRLDLSGLTFVDSAGLRAIVMAWRRLAAMDRHLVLVNPRPAVRRTLDLAGVTAILGGTAPATERPGRTRPDPSRP